jgi:zinc protease
MTRIFGEWSRARGVVLVSLLGLSGLWPVAMAHAQTPAAAPAAKQTPAQGKLVPQMPPGAPAKPFRFPKPETKTLANGLRVFVVSSQEQPAVSMRLVLTAAGSVHDPAGKPGVAAMTANLLTQGTAKRSAQQVAETIDFVGGSLNASADSDGSYVTATVVKKDLDAAMDLLSDVALHAAFQKEELDRRRQQLLSNLRVEYSDADYLASVIIARAVYGQHPYGLPDEGTPDSAAKLERDDLVRFRDAYYVPNGALLAFAGDITPEAAFAAAEKYFGAWPKKDVSSTAGAPAPTGPGGLRIHLIDKPDAGQTQIRVGRLGIRRNDPDYIPLYVTNRILGGGFNSRLNTEVRQKKGLTYGASSSFTSHKLAGIFEAATFTRTEATVEATQLVVELIGRMATGEVTPAELNFARDYLVGVFPIQTETPEQVAGRVLSVAQFDLPADYYDTYQEKVRAVGVEQVKAMAARYLAGCASQTPCRDAAASLDLVLVGNVSQFRDALKKAFPSAQYEEISYDQLDLLSANLRRGKEVTPPATPEALERGKALVAAAAEAAGGAAVAKVESMELALKGVVFGQVPIEVKVYLAFPSQIRVDVKTPTSSLVQAYDGKTAWMQTAAPAGAVDLPTALNAEVQRGIDLEGGFGVFRQALAGKLEAQLLGEEEVEGKKLLAAVWSSTAGPTKLYFDPATHHLVGARYRQVTVQGAVQTLQWWDDFRPVDGVQFPFRWLNYRDGQKFSETTVQEIKLNTKPDPALFSKPK